jgi:hypothetical protein
MPGHGSFRYISVWTVQAVHVEDALAKIEQRKRGDNADDSQHGGDAQHAPHVPGFGLVSVVNVVVSDRQNGSIVKQRDHHDHDRGDGIEVEDQDRQRHEEQHAQRLRDAVNGVAVHALEDAAALLDRVDDDRQPECSSTIDAAARAASVAPETAMPQSAFFSAGASLTPSPVMPTMWPLFEAHQ